MKLIFKTAVDSTTQEVKNGFNQKLFQALTPPWVNLNLIRFDGCKVADEVHLELKTLFMTQKWISVITAEEETQDCWTFTDEGKLLPWPLAGWKHIHRVEASGEKSSVIIDDITYQCANKILEPLMYPMLWATFAIRPRIYRQFFTRKS